MGCASSTPMVATAGSEMLKAATHVASDAAKSAENAVEDVAGTVGKTIEDAKETVGTAVTGITHDLSNALTEKSGELDKAKNQLLERLHLGGADTVDMADKIETSANHLDTKALEEAARLPTPPPDLDTLSTTTTEPEIAEAFANSPDFTSPTPTKPTNADLEKLNEKVKQAMQTNATAAVVAAAAAADADATNGITTEVKHALTGESIGSIADTEPAVDLVAWLAAEKRPNTTEWEKNADRLSKTRKKNAFKGGGKFRRFGPVTSQMLPIHPANYIQPIEGMKSPLLDDDSCYSDVYYNSRSSSPQSTRSNSPTQRRARLPTTSVLNMNAKYMQRELAALLHDRRLTENAMRSLMVSPALGRQFDYNPQRARYTSPTPSVMGFTGSTFTPPLVLEPELPPLQRTANWKRNRETSHLNLLQPPQLVPPIRANTPQLSSNVIPQSKIRSTKAFAPLRAQKTASGRSMQFGYTRTGSPVNRRVFARRSDLPATSKARAFTMRSDSPVRTRALIQERIETAKRDQKQLAQPSTIIKLERAASVEANKDPSLEQFTANGFSLSRALSPIKMAAESHSLTHLKSMEAKTASSTQSFVEVVEQAVKRSKSGKNSTESDVRSGKHGQAVSTQASKREEKSSAEVKSPHIENPKGKDEIKSVKEDRKPAKEKRVGNTNANSSRSSKRTATAVRQRSKTQSISANDIVSRKSDSEKSSPSTLAEDDITGNLGRISANLNKQENLQNSSNEKGKGAGKHSSSGERNQSSGDNLKGTEEVLDSNSQLDPRSDELETRRGPIKQNNGWKSSNSRGSEIKYTNISNRFEPQAVTSFITKEIHESAEVQHESSRSSESVIDDGVPSSNEAEKNVCDSNGSHAIYSTETTDDYNSSPQSRFNQDYESGWREEGHRRDDSSTSEQNTEEEVETHDSARLRRSNVHQKSKSPINNTTQTIPAQASNNPSHTQADHHHTKDNQNNIAYKSFKTNSPKYHRDTSTPLKYTAQTTVEVPNSLNSSPSKSSKSSTSIIIRTILTTPETEYSYEAVASPKRLHEQRFETIEEVNYSHTSAEESSQSDLAETSEPSLVSSSAEQEQEHTKSSTASFHSPHKDINIYVASSIEELLNMLPPDTAYLKLGRSATTLALRSSSPILDAQYHSYRSTPRRYKRHSACDNHHVERVPFVSELSSVSPSRSPFVPSPYRMRARCAVCYNKYVIK